MKYIVSAMKLRIAVSIPNVPAPEHLVRQNLSGNCYEQDDPRYSPSNMNVTSSLQDLNYGTVLMADGSVKKLQDIKVCDLVMGVESRENSVEKVYSGIGELYEICLDDKTACIGTLKHMLALKRKSDNHFISMSVNKYSELQPKLKKQLCSFQNLVTQYKNLSADILTEVSAYKMGQDYCSQANIPNCINQVNCKWNRSI